MRHVATYVPVLAFLAVCGVLILWDAPVTYLAALLASMGPMAYVAFVLLLVLAVVVAPLTVMPLIPMAAMTLGPLATALLSIVGWTLGAVIAFLLARHLGRPVLAPYVSFARIDAIAEDLSPHTRFLFIVLMRLCIPVDIASYALGLTKHIGLVEYTLATAVGVTWFSFAFAYIGDALITGDTLLMIQLGATSLLIFGGAWLLLKRRTKRKG